MAHMIAKQAFDLGFIPVMSSFAGALKEAAEKAGCAKKDNPEGYRKFCQELGASKRLEDPDYWVNLFDVSIKRIDKEEKKALDNNEQFWERCVIVDDCRYPNEVRYALDKKATTLFLMYGDRDNPNQHKSWVKHESEELANTICKDPSLFKEAFQYFIKNDAGSKDLEDKVEIGASFWCGVQADPNSSTGMKELSKCISELIDLLLLNALEKDDDEEETN